MTLQALREQVGDDAFFAILRGWIDEHRDSTASTDDFVALAEEVSGDELDDLFQAWLYDPELPALSGPARRTASRRVGASPRTS